MGLHVGGMILRHCAQAEQSTAQHLRQNFHLVNLLNSILKFEPQLLRNDRKDAPCKCAQLMPNLAPCQVVRSKLCGTPQVQSNFDHAMRKAALLYNPESGGRKQRPRELESALAVLRSGGVEADLVPTESPHHAAEETRRAVDSGCDTIVVAAGVGVDAHLFYKLHSGTKQRMGMAAYYAKAWHLWFSYPMTRFVAEYMAADSDAVRRVEVTELMAVRIRNFGGVLQELAPGASLDRDDMRLVFCRTASRVAYLAYV